jgi:hypothetical protein
MTEALPVAFVDSFILAEAMKSSELDLDVAGAVLVWLGLRLLCPLLGVI